LWEEDYIKFNFEKKQIIRKCDLSEFRDKSIEDHDDIQDVKENVIIKDIIDFCKEYLRAFPEKKQLYFWI